MNAKSIIIVGNKFHAFAKNKEVLTVDEVIFLMKNNLLSDNLFSFKLGQGLSAYQVAELIQYSKILNSRSLLKFKELVKSEKSHTHKYESRNSMLGLPRKICEKSFEIDILIDDSCDQMNDHITGHHLQGMVLSEATRQAFLVITEKFFLKENHESNYFVINSVNTKYLDFAFPLPMIIEYEIVNHTIKTYDTQHFNVVMNIIQYGKVCVEVSTSFSIYNTQWLENKEEKMSSDAIRYAINNEESKHVAA